METQKQVEPRKGRELPRCCTSLKWRYGYEEAVPREKSSGKMILKLRDRKLKCEKWGRKGMGKTTEQLIVASFSLSD